MNTFMPGVDGAGHHDTATPGRVSPLHRLIATLIALTMVIGSVAMTIPAASADTGTQTTTTADLNLRSGPTLSAQIITVIPSDAGLTVLGAPENGFYPVNWNGHDGFAYGAYLTNNDVTEGPLTTGGQQGEVNVAVGPVNFRTGPSLADGVISVIPAGATVLLTGDSANGFLSIVYSDRAGWAHAASVLGTDESVAPAPPAEESAEVATEVPAEPETPATDAPETLAEEPAEAAAEIPAEEPAEVATEAPADIPAEETTEVATEVPAEVATEEPADVSTEVVIEESAEPETPPVDGSDGYAEDEIIQIIYEAADRYGQPREDMLRVAQCESTLDPSVVNPASDASGLFQFLPSTWATTPYADQDIFDPVVNANAAAWMWSEGRRGEWVCQ